MSHPTPGHYARKHSQTSRRPDIMAALKDRAQNNQIPCAAVHAVATDFGITPKEVGAQADLLEMRLTHCILGLFGYKKGTQGTSKILDSAIRISPDLETAICSQAGADKRLSCIQCWEIAKACKVKRLEVSSACEQLGIKIKPCQLGAF